jgi:hypothetical protein
MPVRPPGCPWPPAPSACTGPHGASCSPPPPPLSTQHRENSEQENYGKVRPPDSPWPPVPSAGPGPHVASCSPPPPPLSTRKNIEKRIMERVYIRYHALLMSYYLAKPPSPLLARKGKPYQQHR